MSAASIADAQFCGRVTNRRSPHSGYVNAGPPALLPTTAYFGMREAGIRVAKA
jgi:hypothetical protein